VIWGECYAADDAALLKYGKTREYLFFRKVEPARHFRIGKRRKWKPTLRRTYQLSVYWVQLHAFTRKPMKNSLSFGKRRTESPVSRSISLAASSMPSGVSQARTNHMLR